LYQFPLPLMLAAAVAGAVRLRRERPADLIGLVVLLAVNVWFAFSYQVPDRFAFYLPVYLLVALLAAPGLDAMLARAAAGGAGRRTALALAAFTTGIAPPIVYALAPGIVGTRLPSVFPSARELPGRDPILFHLYPGKRGYDGARRFCLDAL